jgi:putative nucleotidyltransferase with HDIG domain
LILEPINNNNPYFKALTKLSKINMHNYRHPIRVGELTLKLADILGYEDRNKIYHSACLHDIGKYKVIDLINLPRTLTDSEYKEVKNHTIYGAELFKGIDELKPTYQVVKHHHEKYDGSGYPDGLRGESIPFEARLVCIIDIFDAICSPRVYKATTAYQETYDIFKHGDKKQNPDQFDPIILKIFLDNYDSFVAMHKLEMTRV